MNDMPVIGPFRVSHVAGEGSSGLVLKGEHISDGVPVAIKIGVDRMSNRITLQDQYLSEVRAIARLNHPGIVTIFDYGRLQDDQLTVLDPRLVQGAPYLVMEWIDQGTLRNHQQTLDWNQLRSILLRLLDALATAHAQGIVHRDIKPANILMSDRGPILTDFGVAFLEQSDEVHGDGNIVMGTPNYMSPEQIRGDWRALGPWTDLYGLGCLTYRMICGRRPYVGQDFAEIARQHLTRPIPRLTPLFPVPASLDSWLTHLLAKSPRHRYQLAADAAFDLLNLDESSTIHPSPGSTSNEHPGLESTDSLGDQTLLSPQIFVPVTDSGWAGRSKMGHGPGVPETWRPPTRSERRSPLTGVGRTVFGLTEAEFVGRERERTTIWGLLRKVVAESSTQCVSIEGLSGQGKTALARWIAERAHTTGAALPLWTRHQNPNGATCGLQGMLHQFFGTQGLDLDEQDERIVAVCETNGLTDLRRTLSSILEAEGSLFGAPEDEPAQPSAPERYEALCVFLQHLTQRRPRILVIDDIQWGPDAQLFVRHLLNNWSQLPLLVLVTMRTDALDDRALQPTTTLGALANRPAVQRISLSPLNQHDHFEMLRHRLDLEPEILSQLRERTEGNPLFTEELIRHWIKNHALVPGPNGFRLVDNQGGVLPESIHGVWLSRLNRLTAPNGPEWQALELAATLGLTVQMKEWALVCESAQLELPSELLTRLFDEELAYFASEDEWAFRHALFREFLQAHAHSHTRLIRWNGLCADMLTRPGSQATNERVGDHLLSAKRFEEAVQPLRLAMKFYSESSNYPEVRRQCVAYARALRGAGIQSNGLEWYELRVRWAVCARVEGDPETARRYVRRNIKFARRDGRQKELIQALLQLSLIERYVDATETRATLEDAMEVAEKLGEPKELAEVRNAMGELYADEGRTDEARAYFQAVIEQGDLEHVGIYASALNGLTRNACFEGDYETAAQYADRATQLARKSSSRWVLGDRLCTRGNVRRNLGQLADAEADYRDAADALRRIGNIDLWAAEANLALIMMERQQWAASFQQTEEVLKTCRRFRLAHAERLVRCLQFLPVCHLRDTTTLDQLIATEREAGLPRSSQLDCPRFLEKAAATAEVLLDHRRAASIWMFAANHYAVLNRQDDAQRCMGHAEDCTV